MKNKWSKTSDSLPGIPGQQCDVLMWSPEWATWLKGMVTRWADGSCEWAIYDQQNDRYYECEYPPEYWLCPSVPNESDPRRSETGEGPLGSGPSPQKKGNRSRGQPPRLKPKSKKIMITETKIKKDASRERRGQRPRTCGVAIRGGAVERFSGPSCSHIL